jgi:hypothetical protein
MFGEAIPRREAQASEILPSGAPHPALRATLSPQAGRGAIALVTLE